MLSVNPTLSASAIRSLLTTTSKKLKGQTAWTQELGWGRLDVAKAVEAAKSAGSAPPVGVKKAPGKKARAKKAPGKKARAKKAPVKKATVKKARGKKVVAKKAPARKGSATKASTRRRAAARR